MQRLKFCLLVIALFSLGAPARGAAAEPSVDEVRTAALRYAGLDRTAPRWARRARLRHLLPKVSGRVAWMSQTSEGVDFDEFLSRDAEGDLLFDAAKNETQHDSRDRVTYSVYATINLGGLIFDRAELQAAREQLRWSEARRELIEAVHEAYFLRLGLRDELSEGVDDRRETALRILQVEARLDGLTGGWFRRRLDEGGE